eukprot:Awhi_evm1s15183
MDIESDEEELIAKPATENKKKGPSPSDSLLERNSCGSPSSSNYRTSGTKLVNDEYTPLSPPRSSSSSPVSDEDCEMSRGLWIHNAKE